MEQGTMDNSHRCEYCSYTVVKKKKKKKNGMRILCTGVPNFSIALVGDSFNLVFLHSVCCIYLLKHFSFLSPKQISPFFKQCTALLYKISWIINSDNMLVY